MKSKMKIKMKIAGKLWGLSAILLFVSCAKGFDDNETFSGGVTNAQLESPENISFSTLTNADGSESLKLTWPVVMGAGGFKVNVYNMNDPVNPVAVIADSIVDGRSCHAHQRNAIPLILKGNYPICFLSQNEKSRHDGYSL